MGLCCSANKQDPSLLEKNQTQNANATTNNQTKQASKEEKEVELQPQEEEAQVEKPKKNTSSSQEEVEEVPKKQELNVSITTVSTTVSKPEETRISTPVRTSSCNKEDVDAILIQCGRLSRSSSEKRKYSGSKRSFDDDEKKEGEEEELAQTVSRPSPRRRRHSRERSGSKERAGSQRRVSRSPNRRNESEKLKQQPIKMVPVPPCEKVVIDETGMKRAETSSNNSNITTAKRTASPKSRVLSENSNVVHQASLSRSGSKKGEQTPFRRNPMREIDENLMKGCGCGGVKKATQIQTQCNDIATKKTTSDQSGDSKTTSKASDSSIKTTRSSSRSRDLDNTTNYTSSLMEDIQNYHQQNTGFTLPACLSKACTILEAVADLNSFSSDQSHAMQKGNSANPVGELQESAGSNSYVGQGWHSRNSVDSTERNWTLQCGDGECRGGGSSGSSRVPGNGFRGGRKDYSLPVVAADASS